MRAVTFGVRRQPGPPPLPLQCRLRSGPALHDGLQLQCRLLWQLQPLRLLLSGLLLRRWPQLAPRLHAQCELPPHLLPCHTMPLQCRLLWQLQPLQRLRAGHLRAPHQRLRMQGLRPRHLRYRHRRHRPRSVHRLRSGQALHQRSRHRLPALPCWGLLHRPRLQRLPLPQLLGWHLQPQHRLLLRRRLHPLPCWSLLHHTGLLLLLHVPPMRLRHLLLRDGSRPPRHLRSVPSGLPLLLHAAVENTDAAARRAHTPRPQPPPPCRPACSAP